MKKPFVIVAVVVVIGLGFFFYSQKGGNDNFLRQQAIQSALFPVLGPILNEKAAQPVQVLINEKAFGVVVDLSRVPITDHSEREDFRAKLTVAAREWAKTKPELSGLQTFITFKDELGSTPSQ